MASSTPFTSASPCRSVSPNPSHRVDDYMEDEEDDKLRDWLRNQSRQAHQEQQQRDHDQTNLAHSTLPSQSLIEEIKQSCNPGLSQERLKLQTDFMGHLMTEEGEEDEYDRPFKSYFNHHEVFNKKFGNLAAIDCFATIYGQTAYQKTYQDKLEVEKLVNDDRPLNIHKLFTSEDSPSPTMAMPSHIIGQQQNYYVNQGSNLKFKDNQNGGQIQIAKQSPPICQPEDTLLIGLSQDYYDQVEQDQTHYYQLQKLFEDQNEKQRMIKSNIEHSQLKKRQRVNSGVSNSSKGRQSESYQPQKYLSQKSAENNADLLKAFNEDVAKCQGIDLGSIFQTLKSDRIQESLLEAFQLAQSQIRMEEPSRVLLRFSLNLARNLFGLEKFKGQNSAIRTSNSKSAHPYFSNHIPYSVPAQIAAVPPDLNQSQIAPQFIVNNDVTSISQSFVMADSNQSQSRLTKGSQSSTGKRKAKGFCNWSSDDSKLLAELVRAKNKEIHLLNDADLSELAQKFEVTPLKIQQKVRKIHKDIDQNMSQGERDKDVIFDKEGNPICFDESEPPSGKDQKKVMIARALKQLPQNKGTGAEIIKKIEQIYKLDLKKNSTLRNTLDQTLSKYFHKINQEITLNMQSDDYSDFTIGRNPSMKDMIISCLLKIKDNKADSRLLKLKMLELFGDKLREDYKEETMNLNQRFFTDQSQTSALGNITYKWENNMQKTIIKYKDTFLKSKTEYSSRNPHAQSYPLIAEEFSQMSLVSNNETKLTAKASATNVIHPFYQYINPIFPQFSGFNPHIQEQQHDYQAAVGPVNNVKLR